MLNAQVVPIPQMHRIHGVEVTSAQRRRFLNVLGERGRTTVFNLGLFNPETERKVQDAIERTVGMVTGSEFIGNENARKAILEDIAAWNIPAYDWNFIPTLMRGFALCAPLMEAPEGEEKGLTIFGRPFKVRSLGALRIRWSGDKIGGVNIGRIRPDMEEIAQMSNSQLEYAYSRRRIPSKRVPQHLKGLVWAVASLIHNIVDITRELELLLQRSMNQTGITAEEISHQDLSEEEIRGYALKLEGISARISPNMDPLKVLAAEKIGGAVPLLLKGSYLGAASKLNAATNRFAARGRESLAMLYLNFERLGRINWQLQMEKRQYAQLVSGIVEARDVISSARQAKPEREEKAGRIADCTSQIEGLFGRRKQLIGERRIVLRKIAERKEWCLSRSRSREDRFYRIASLLAHAENEGRSGNWGIMIESLRRTRDLAQSYETWGKTTSAIQGDVERLEQINEELPYMAGKIRKRVGECRELMCVSDAAEDPHIGKIEESLQTMLRYLRIGGWDTAHSYALQAKTDAEKYHINAKRSPFTEKGRSELLMKMMELKNVAQTPNPRIRLLKEVGRCIEQAAIHLFDGVFTSGKNASDAEKYLDKARESLDSIANLFSALYAAEGRATPEGHRKIRLAPSQ